MGAKKTARIVIHLNLSSGISIYGFLGSVPVNCENITLIKVVVRIIIAVANIPRLIEDGSLFKDNPKASEKGTWYFFVTIRYTIANVEKDSKICRTTRKKFMLISMPAYNIIPAKIIDKAKIKT
ncbi:MAG: hypothetical protein A2Y25_08285 [Candidatus Melainabacteria bacterium GWF2_37_15]|nr:MAG: hypothetical protein A2Y25_08285 [Candidatus Melainabacteria bacterium GWF2_37_15]